MITDELVDQATGQDTASQTDQISGKMEQSEIEHARDIARQVFQAEQELLGERKRIISETENRLKEIDELLIVLGRPRVTAPRAATPAPAASGSTRGRGRPKGSTNKPKDQK